LEFRLCSKLIVGGDRGTSRAYLIMRAAAVQICLPSPMGFFGTRDMQKLGLPAFGRAGGVEAVE
jgi:hypothetical protein